MQNSYKKYRIKANPIYSRIVLHTPIFFSLFTLFSPSPPLPFLFLSHSSRPRARRDHSKQQGVKNSLEKTAMMDASNKQGSIRVLYDAFSFILFFFSFYFFTASYTFFLPSASLLHHFHSTFSGFLKLIPKCWDVLCFSRVPSTKMFIRKIIFLNLCPENSTFDSCWYRFSI